MQKTILVVEDAKRLSDSLCKHLDAEGFDYLQAINGQEALQQFIQYSPDLIILDIMLPDMSGIEVCQKIRKMSDVPIIMLTARIDEIDRVKGFEVGADDYVCKPFSPKELIFRIQAILRRVVVLSPVVNFKHGPISLYLDQYRVTVDDKNISVTMIEFQILRVLMGQPDHAFSRADLLMAAHGKYSENYDRTVDTHIKNLRKKINLNEKYCFIKTVYGVGYRLGFGLLLD